MTRRGFARQLLGAAAMIVAVSAGLAVAPPLSTLARNLRELVDHDSAAVVGRVRLAARPDEADAEALVRQLAADGLSLDRPSPLPSAIHERVRARIRDDFAEGRIAVVDGWRLSLTEVRLCTLAALV